MQTTGAESHQQYKDNNLARPSPTNPPTFHERSPPVNLSVLLSGNSTPSAEICQTRRTAVNKVRHGAIPGDRTALHHESIWVIVILPMPSPLYEIIVKRKEIVMDTGIPVRTSGTGAPHADINTSEAVTLSVRSRLLEPNGKSRILKQSSQSTKQTRTWGLVAETFPTPAPPATFGHMVHSLGPKHSDFMVENGGVYA
jgi:hypothetical protein